MSAAASTQASPGDAEKRAAILEAADRLFVRYGFKKTTIDDVAAEAGVGKGTIYYYFRSKQELLLAYADECMEAIHAAAAEAAETPGHFVDRLTAMMRAKLLGIWDRVHAGPHGEEIFNSLFPQMVERQCATICFTRERIQALLEEAAEQGTVRVEDPEQAAELVHRSFASFAPPYTPLTGTREEIEAGIAAMARLTYEGLR